MADDETLYRSLIRQYITPPTTDEEGSGPNKSRNFIAGGVAGILSRTLTAPLDRFRMLSQFHGTTLSYFAVERMLVGMVKQKGLKVLWRGNFLNCLKIAPELSLKFSIYEKAKNYIFNNETIEGKSVKLDFKDRFIAGATAGVVSQAAIFPLETIRTRVTVDLCHDHRIILSKVILKMLRCGGLHMFYRGFLANCIGIMLYGGIDLAIYETLKRSFLIKSGQLGENERQGPEVQLPFYQIIVCSGISTITGQLATYPLSLIRTRMQAAEMKRSERPKMLDHIHYVWKKKGFFGFYTGFSYNVSKVIPAITLTYYFYERTLSYLGGNIY